MSGSSVGCVMDVRPVKQCPCKLMHASRFARHLTFVSSFMIPTLYGASRRPIQRVQPYLSIHSSDHAQFRFLKKPSRSAHGRQTQRLLRGPPWLQTVFSRSVTEFGDTRRSKWFPRTGALLWLADTPRGSGQSGLSSFLWMGTPVKAGG